MDIYPYVFVKPGPLFTDSDETKVYYPAQSAASINLEDYPEGHEMLGAEIFIGDIWKLPSALKFSFAAYNDATNTLIWSGTGTVPPFDSDVDGYYYPEYFYRCWIGHAAWEVNSAMKVRIEVNVSGGGFPTTSKTVYQEVKTKLPAVPTITGKLYSPEHKSTVYGTVEFGGKSVTSDSTSGIYVWSNPPQISGPIVAWGINKTMKSEEKMITAPSTGTLTVNFDLYDITPPPPPPEKDSLDYLKEAINKLVHLDFKGAWEAFIAGIKAPYPTDPEKNKEATDKLFEIMILALPVGSASEIETLVKGPNFKYVLEAIRKEPARWAKLMPELTTETKSILMAALKKQADPTAYKLAAESLEAAAKAEGLSAIEKVLGVLPGATTGKKLFIAFSSLVGAVAGYVGLAQFLAWTGKEAIKEAISFSGLYLAMDNKDWKLANENLPILKDAIEAYKKSTALARIIPFIGDIWNKAIEEAEREYENYKTIVEEGLKTIPELKGTLKVSPTPADAKVSVSGQIPTTGTFEALLDAGIYRVVVSLFGYVSQSRDLEVLENTTTTWNPTLEKEVAPPPEKAKLVVDCVPDETLVSVAGRPEITKEGEYFLDAGSYTLNFSLEGYEPSARTVYLKAGEAEIVSITLKKIEIPSPAPPVEETGTLNLVVTPSDAIISIPGKPEITTAGTYVLPAGTYSITITKEGYETKTQTAIIRTGVTTSINIALTPSAPPPEALATLTIKSEPTNSDVYIDGNYTYTKTPYTTKLEAGTYIIRCQMKDYYPYEVSVELKAGDVGEITLPLTKIPVAEVPVVPYTPWEYYYPEYAVPSAPQVQVQPAPYATLPTPAYNLLDEAPYFYEPALDVEKPYMKELIVNVETTDVLPFKGRIISIAFLDLTDPEMMPKVITGDNEEDVLNTFLDFFDAGGFTKIVGFNVSFDHRFIFTKAALYRRQCKLWANIQMRDIMQILQQVKEAYVFGFNKPGTLDDWGKHLLGVGKYGSQEECLQRFIRKDFDYVDAFNLRQVELARDLYQLLRYVLGEAVISRTEALQSTISSPVIPEYPPAFSLPQTKKCPNCLQENKIEATECIVCGTKI